MKFLIVTHVKHIIGKEGNVYAYGPYVKEMNLWLKNCDEVTIVAPASHGEPGKIDLAYAHQRVNLRVVAAFQLTSLKEIVRAFLHLPRIAFRVYRAMYKADHIHLRSPGNMGLIGAFLQILFPKKPKTAKYAGNWDWQSKQPWSYRLQQRILQHTFLTKNMQVLVYGHWPRATENIKPFFAASYTEAYKVATPPRSLARQPLKLIFVGSLTEGKQPLLSVKVCEALAQQRPTELHVYGDGPLMPMLQDYCDAQQLQHTVFLHGNQPADVVKMAFQESHFLIFISKSEGWPKVVAEAMFWGCVPITTAVSCVPEMLGNGTRGTLVSAATLPAVLAGINAYLADDQFYKETAQRAMEWSRMFTLERFEQEIQQLLT